ncbi:MAG: hypothetical protein B7Y70_02480 [Rhizobiales bacterium 35-68-8]|jgi:hypothetical protein|nr:MAG: hypothetical protein B7Y70_02480 [Rhizobiales bacterium 35-68-8]
MESEADDTDSDIMIEPKQPISPAHVPWFVSAPGQPDILMIVMGIFLVLFTFILGLLVLRLHHLPEHIAHKGQKFQYEIVAVLCLLAMFTHQNILWVAALLLAMIDLPDFSSLFARIAQSLERIAQRRRPRQQRPSETADTEPR